MDRSTFANLALAELPAVYRLAYHLCADKHDVDDVVQETYLHALRAADQFRLMSCGVRPWLFKILHNVVNARFGKQRREDEALEGLRHAPNHNAADGPSSDGEAAAPLAMGEQGCLSGISWDGIDERLKHAIDDLPFNQKVVFLLSAVEGLRYREVAETVGAPIGTVMSRLHRARAQLAAQLSELAIEHGIRPANLPNREMNSSP